MFHDARAEDLDAIRRRYRQLHPDDPQVGDGSDGQHLPDDEACGFSPDAKSAFLARPGNVGRTS